MENTKKGRSRLRQKIQDVGAVLGAIYIAFQIYDWVTKDPEHDLRLYVEASEYQRDLATEAAMLRFRSIYERTEIYEDLLRMDYPKDKIHPTEKLRMLVDEIDEVRHQQFSGFAALRLRNGANTPASDVEVGVPVPGVYRFIDSNGNVMSGKLVSNIPVGEVRAKEELTVHVWLNSELQPYTLNNIVLRHSEGLGSVDWSLPATGWVKALQRHKDLISYVAWFLGVALSVFFTLLLLSRFIHHSQTRSQTTDAGDGESKELKE